MSLPGQEAALLRKLALICLLCLFHAPVAHASDDKTVLLKKSQLLLQKAIRSESRGEIEDAVALYEESCNICPTNMMPLLHWGKLLCKIGMYDRASELLGKIPLDKLSEAGQSEVHLSMGRIAIARSSVEDAASAYSRALKVFDKNEVARIRLAMVNLLLGMSSRTDELLRDYDSFAGFDYSELRLALIIDMHMATFGRAFSTCGEMAGIASRAGKREDSDSSIFDPILKMQPTIFIFALPLGLSGVMSGIYFVALFSGLMFLATRLTAPTAHWHNAAFVILGVVTMIATQAIMKREFFIALLQGELSLSDTVWIMPRMLIAGHLLAIALYAVFPAFRLLPEDQRPKRYELYGIWFFCWFFMAFVLVFQSRIGFGNRMLLLVATLGLSVIMSFFIPLGRFVVFRITSLLGYGDFATLSRQDLRKQGGISFTDAKIFETKSWKLIEKDEFEETIMIARKVFGSFDRKTFPLLWKAYVFALLAREDLVEAQQQINEFLEVFKLTSSLESGQLYEALLKSRKGDFGGALKIIRALPEQRVKSFSADENALSLMILARCALACNENVQAHIDLNKAFNVAKLPLIKAEILVEIAELDFNLKSKEALLKLKEKISSLSGGEKVDTYKNIVLSIIAQSENIPAEALKLAEQACRSKAKNSRACAWYGHLLCLSGDFAKAEEQLTRMAPDSHDTSKLMAEVTSSS